MHGNEQLSVHRRYSIIGATGSSYIMQKRPEGVSSNELCGSVEIISGAFRQNELFHCSQP